MKKITKNIYITPKKIKTSSLKVLPKVPTGIQGLDEITFGGLPKGRPTLICGSAGSGKTLFSLEFLLHGILQYNEPGVLMTFEETAEELAQNVGPLKFDINKLISNKKLIIENVKIERSQIAETGEYDLEGLFIRLNHAINLVKAKRVVIDSIETLFAGLNNYAILRSEIKRLFAFLKEKQVSAVVTGERGQEQLTRSGLEEYISDCVILLDQRMIDQVSTRRLRIVKYRGTAHGTNEYPFLIDEKGISVMPLTSIGLQYNVSSERISTGIKKLDEMLGEKGYFRGSTILISGTAGSGKTSIAAFFAASCCEKKERILFLSFEESSAQLTRNLSSIGLNLQKYINDNRMKIVSTRPSGQGLEGHILKIYKLIDEFKPHAIIMDPITGFTSQGNHLEIQSMLTRIIDLFKSRYITSIFTGLVSGTEAIQNTDFAISSLIDTWIVVREIESIGQRRRGLYVLKSRGMPHSSQAREFRMSSQGIDLL